MNDKVTSTPLSFAYIGRTSVDKSILQCSLKPTIKLHQHLRRLRTLVVPQSTKYFTAFDITCVFGKNLETKNCFIL